MCMTFCQPYLVSRSFLSPTPLTLFEPCTLAGKGYVREDLECYWLPTDL